MLTLRLNFCYLKFFPIFHPCCYPKIIISYILKKQGKEQFVCIPEIMRLIIMKMKMKNRSYRYHSVHPLPFLLGGVEAPTKFSEREGAWQDLNRGGWLFLMGWGWRGGGRLQFLHKNKLKSEIFNDKKVYKQKCFSLS